MPQLELTELEIKTMWLILDRPGRFDDPAMQEAEISLFDKLYHHYRGMPPKAA